MMQQLSLGDFFQARPIFEDLQAMFPDHRMIGQSTQCDIQKLDLLPMEQGRSEVP